MGRIRSVRDRLEAYPTHAATPTVVTSSASIRLRTTLTLHPGWGGTAIDVCRASLGASANRILARRYGEGDGVVVAGVQAGGAQGGLLHAGGQILQGGFSAAHGLHSDDPGLFPGAGGDLFEQVLVFGLDPLAQAVLATQRQHAGRCIPKLLEGARASARFKVWPKPNPCRRNGSARVPRAFGAVPATTL